MKRISMSLLAAAGLWLLATSAVGQDKMLSDEFISKRLVGKWVFAKSEKGESVKIELTANKDGSYTFSKKIDIDRGDAKESSFTASSGMWKVANGKIELGKEKPMPVIEIDEKKLKTLASTGEVLEWKRVKD